MDYDDCPVCSGTGRNEHGNTCERCGGTGEVLTNPGDYYIDEPDEEEEP